MTEKSLAVAKTKVPAPGDIFDTWRRNVDRLFDDFGGFAALSPLKLSPRLDVTDTDGVIEVTAELPGLEEKDVDVSVEDGALTISGEKKAQTEKKEKNYVYSERSYGSFVRRIPLPSGVDAKSVNAKMNKGVLTVTVTKPTSAKATKIEVKSAA
jgi:HSP20 family protein